jgi:F420-dependent oxidoreductase-like protein
VKLGLMAGYWTSGPPHGALEAILEADRLGFDSVWTAEAYGSDALSPLAWWGAQTSQIGLGTAIMQMSARTPAATAMAAMTMDHLSGGRFRLGLGVSGPQVVEGWYGQPFPKPLERTREYVSIMRDIFAREAPVTHSGAQYQMPYQGGTGLGKPLKSTVHPFREDLPIYLGAEGPKNVALAAEICDGWLPIFFAPKDNGFYKGALEEGFARPGARQTMATFDMAASIPFIPNPDLEQAADMVRPMLALYIGGMGAKGRNFHYDVFIRMGYEEACEKIQELYLSGDKVGAAAAVPLEMVDEMALIGEPARIKDHVARLDESVIKTILISGPPALMQVAADIILD